MVSRYSVGLSVQIRTVSLLPPTALPSSRVSLESRYGTWTLVSPLTRAARARTTRISARSEQRMLLPSLFCLRTSWRRFCAALSFPKPLVSSLSSWSPLKRESVLSVVYVVSLPARSTMLRTERVSVAPWGPTRSVRSMQNWKMVWDRDAFACSLLASTCRCLSPSSFCLRTWSTLVTGNSKRFSTTTPVPLSASTSGYFWRCLGLRRRSESCSL
mmetsp:Transcript_33073/g.55364  ORF Transcript_33073/g.55364 Transcript_33073/m.55364 type:complete len:215 (+) Transcript_33073:210-854(+)